MTKYNATIKRNLETCFITSIILISTNFFSQEKPKSIPNNGSTDIEWTIENYNYFVEYESDDCIKKNNITIAIEDLKVGNEINLLKSKLSNKEIDEKYFNNTISSMETNYNNKVNELNNICSEKLVKNSKYRDEWVAYLLAKEKVDIENKKNENNIRAAEISEAIKKAENIINSKYFKIGEPINYNNWKIKYFALIKSANKNIIVIDNIIKKHTFRNNYGNKVWDPSDLSKQERLLYKKNIEEIKNILDQIDELRGIDSYKFFNQYEDFIINNGTFDDAPHHKWLNGYWESHLNY